MTSFRYSPKCAMSLGHASDKCMDMESSHACACNSAPDSCISRTVTKRASKPNGKNLYWPCDPIATLKPLSNSCCVILYRPYSRHSVFKT